MRTARSLALLAFLLSSSTLAQAADPVFSPEPIQSSSGWIVTVKGNLRVGPSYPGSDDFSFIGYPSLSFRRAGTVERFSAPDDGLSFSFLDESVFRVGVVGRFVGGRYYEDNRELVGLDKIDWAVEPGVFVEYWPLEFLRARAEIRRGFGGHEGFVADFGLDAVHVTAYRPSGGITSVGATGAVSYDWSQQWSTTAFVTYKHLVSDAADSPIVERFGSEHQFGLGLTVSYSFGYTP
ncbi:MAG: hypothetical protein K0Q60_3390 [Microvirga sp.]|nr:hypothetical protein [Microvirga sp.]